MTLGGAPFASPRLLPGGFGASTAGTRASKAEPPASRRGPGRPVGGAGGPPSPRCQLAAKRHLLGGWHGLGTVLGGGQGSWAADSVSGYKQVPPTCLPRSPMVRTSPSCPQEDRSCTRCEFYPQHWLQHLPFVTTRLNLLHPGASRGFASLHGFSWPLTQPVCQAGELGGDSLGKAEVETSSPFSQLLAFLSLSKEVLWEQNISQPVWPARVPQQGCGLITRLRPPAVAVFLSRGGIASH